MLAWVHLHHSHLDLLFLLLCGKDIFTIVIALILYDASFPFFCICLSFGKLIVSLYPFCI